MNKSENSVKSSHNTIHRENTRKQETTCTYDYDDVSWLLHVKLSAHLSCKPFTGFCRELITNRGVIFDGDNDDDNDWDGDRSQQELW